MPKKDYKKHVGIQSEKRQIQSSDSNSSSPSKHRSISITPSSKSSTLILPILMREGETLAYQSFLLCQQNSQGVDLEFISVHCTSCTATTTTTAHQPLIGDSSLFFLFLLHYLVGLLLLVSLWLKMMIVDLYGDSPVDPFSVQAGSTATTTTAQPLIGDSHSKKGGQYGPVFRPYFPQRW